VISALHCIHIAHLHIGNVLINKFSDAAKFIVGKQLPTHCDRLAQKVFKTDVGVLNFVEGKQVVVVDGAVFCFLQSLQEALSRLLQRRAVEIFRNHQRDLFTQLLMHGKTGINDFHVAGHLPALPLGKLQYTEGAEQQTHEGNNHQGAAAEEQLLAQIHRRACWFTVPGACVFDTGWRYRY